jgi:hypothetical protein
LYGFDLLEIGGEDLRRHPWEIRRSARAGSDDAPRLSRAAADHAAMIGTAMIGTAITLQPERTGPDRRRA